jgi:hypothetical protein
MVIRRTDAQRAAARLRRLNDPPPPRSRRRGRQPFPEPGAITELFREARRAHR